MGKKRSVWERTAEMLKDFGTIIIVSVVLKWVVNAVVGGFIPNFEINVWIVSTLILFVLYVKVDSHLASEVVHREKIWKRNYELWEEIESLFREKYVSKVFTWCPKHKEFHPLVKNEVKVVYEHGCSFDSNNWGDKCGNVVKIEKCLGEKE